MVRVLLSLVLLTFASGAAAQALRGRHCSAQAPGDWRFTGERAERQTFGADLQRADGAVLASYFLVGVPADMRRSATYGQWFGSPHQAAIAMLSHMGRQPVQCGQPSAGEAGLWTMQCRTPQHVGVAVYQAHPTPDDGFVLVMRTAGAVPQLWPVERESAIAVSRSIRCNVPLKPPQDHTGGRRGWGGG